MEYSDKLFELAKSTDELLDNSDNVSHEEQTLRIRSHIKMLADGYNAGIPHASFISYCLGYSWFWLIDILDEAPIEAEKWLLESIRLKPEHNSNARYYLGFLYFDNEKYTEAKKVIEKIAAGVFEKIGQTWRDVNVRSLKVCTDAIIGSPDFGELNAVCEIYKHDNASEFDLPVYIVNTCLMLWEKERIVTNELISFTRNIIRIIESDCYRDVFVNEHRRLLGFLRGQRGDNDVTS